MGKDQLSKSLPQKTHRERSQPSKSKSFLERKKDWKLRSNDFKVKNTILTNLKKKILNRNPDEFTHEMISHKSAAGGGLAKRDNANAVFDHETLLLLKSQDLAYVKLMNHLNMKKINKLSGGTAAGKDDDMPSSSSTALPSSSAVSNHIIYVDASEANEKDFDLAAHLDTVPELLSRKSNRPRISLLSSNSIINSNQIDKSTLKEIQKEKKKQAAELNARLERRKKLMLVEKEMTLQKDLMKKGSKKKVGVDKTGLAVYKWAARRSK